MGAGASKAAVATGLLAGNMTVKNASILTLDFSDGAPFDPNALAMDAKTMYFNSVDLVPDFSYAGQLAAGFRFLRT
jgi:hypothetical protein